MIRTATHADCDAIARIYNHYVATTIVTFELEPIPAAEMAARLDAVRKLDLPWLVAAPEGGVLGYAYATPWKARPAYRHAVETTVYLDPGATGQGWGTRLYEALFGALRTWGAHAVIGGIALPNPASVALHEKHAMAKVAHFAQVGYKFERWVDVGYWQRIL